MRGQSGTTVRGGLACYGSPHGFRPCKQAGNGSLMDFQNASVNSRSQIIEAAVS